MKDTFGLLYDGRFDSDLLGGPEGLDFLEIIADRFRALDDLGGLPEFLTAIPTVLHSLDLSLGSDEALDRAYLESLSRIAKYFNPKWASDHLAVTRIDGASLGCLSPVRWRAASVERIAAKIDEVQSELGVPFLIENITYYFRIPGADISEGEMLHRLVEKGGCGVLLDVNNLAVNAMNHGFDPYAYLDEFPLHAVGEIHIAGHRKRGSMWIDSHGDRVSELVWDLLRFVSGKLWPVHVLLERDQDIPPFGELMRELSMARRCVAEGRQGQGGAAP